MSDESRGDHVIQRRGRVTFYVTSAGEGTGDPWIDAYLTFREAALSGSVQTTEEVEACALDLQRGLPDGGPSVPAALFITADIQIAFSARSALMHGLWLPR